jgi:hypothetical protein
MKSLNEALENAVKQAAAAATTRRNDPYLSETRLAAVIKKCKTSLHELKQTKCASNMDMDESSNSAADSLVSKDEHIQCFKPLLSLVQRVFQNYSQLALSFRVRADASTSASMPSVAPLNIDFSSLRRSYSMLFAGVADVLLDELERVIDMSVYAMCFTIRMKLKRRPGAVELSEQELDQMLHALILVNELPILENPQYISQCVKAFYATVSELDARESAKIVKMWAAWHADELRIFLNRTQQYISVCIMKKLG